MRRTIIGVLAVVSIGAPLVLPSEAAIAAPGITLVDANDRAIKDVSADGRFVLTSWFSGPEYRLIDRQTGASRDLDVPGGAQRISDDGTRVVFMSEDKLVPGDTDTDLDVYSVVVSTGAYSLLTMGSQPAWGWDAIGGANASGTSVLVLGISGIFGQVAPFVADGVTTRQLATQFPAATSASVFGMTSSGNEVLYSTNGGCTPGPCDQTFHVENIEDPSNVRSRVVLQKTGTNTAIRASEAAMSPDGTLLIAREFFTDSVYTGRTSSPNSMVAVTAPDDYIDSGRLSIAIANGGTYAYLDTIEVPAPLYQSTRAILHTNSSTIVASAPPGVDANEGAVEVMLTSDGTTLFFTSRARNITSPPPPEGRSVYAYGTSLPPSPPTPPGTPPTPPAPPTTFGTSYFTPRTPTRILDTRNGLGYIGARPAPETRITVPVRGLHGVPAGASAVAIQMTAVDGDGIGYLSAFPTSSSPPPTSNLNIDTPGETIANMAIVPIGPDGSITVFTSTSTHVIVDLMGWWSVTQSPVSSGRYSAVGPNRILDTRPESPVNWDQPKPGSGSTTLLHVAGQGGVPATGASAVVVNVTLVDPTTPGFVQAAPASELVIGSSSTLNVSTAGQVIAATTIVPVDSNGNIAIYAQPSTHLVVDLSGWFTDATAPSSSSGLFVPLSVNHRDADTRVGLGFQGPTGPGTRFDIGAYGGALVGNVTMTDNAGAGYVQLGGTVTMVNGATSSINVTRPNETIANSFIVPIRNGVGVYTSNATHVIIDSSGYMTP